MKRIVVILVAICLCGLQAVRAQEQPVRSTPLAPHRSQPFQLWTPASPILPASQWQPQGAPGAEQQTAQSVLLKQSSKVRHKQEREFNRDARLWKTTVGNTAINNWSSHPDRALDARTLRFPLPKKPETKQPKK